jgi:hypothetical protein
MRIEIHCGKETFLSYRIGQWIQTYSGGKIYPLDARIEEINIEDIAHSLSLQCRYTGHCTRFYSVAEHSVYVSWMQKPENALWGLLHDASEAYLTDITRPLKPFLTGYKMYEDNLMRVVCDKYSLPYAMPDDVKETDSRILLDEREQLMVRTEEDWGLDGLEPLGIEIEGWSPDYAKGMFLKTFRALVPA